MPSVAIIARGIPTRRDARSLALGIPWVAASVPALALFAVALPGGSAVNGLPIPDGESLAGLFLFYAAVSVTSQEFLYSSFFFWRYRPLFSPGLLLGLNSLVFGLAHVVFDSWVSVGLAVAGRIVLARVYQRHGSFWGWGLSTSCLAWRPSWRD